METLVLLSVEDRDADFYLIQVALKLAGIPVQVCRVADGEEAILYLHQSGKFADSPKPHLVLLDINLPLRNGFEVLEYMKSNDAFRSIPVVVFTTSTDPIERTRAIALGAEDFITKQNDWNGIVDDLSGVCARFLKGSRTRAAGGN